MKYRNRIPEPGTTISGFADSKKKIKIMPTDPCNTLNAKEILKIYSTELKIYSCHQDE
jgi:hypothetical protein